MAVVLFFFSIIIMFFIHFFKNYKILLVYLKPDNGTIEETF